MTDNFRMTPFGAFKGKKRRPGEKTKDGAMPDIFKFQRPRFVSGEEPTILVYNQSRSWEGRLPVEGNDKLMELFEGRDKIYIIATPDENGKLVLDSMISDQNW